MAHGIDHVVVAVHGIEHAEQAFAALGFTLAPRARHPFGTQNAVIQLDGGYIELLGVVEPDEMPVPEPGAFSFPRFNFRFLERHEGISMLALRSDDARGDAKAFAAARVQSYMPFEFSRTAQRADGSDARLGFRLAFATDPFIPEAVMFACEHLAPADFWRADLRRHANTARRIAEVAMIAEAPSDHHEYFEGVTGVRDIHASSLGLVVDTGGGRIRVLTPEAARLMWGDAVDVGDFRSPRFAAMSVMAADMGAAAECLEAAGVPHDMRAGRLVVPASAAMGVAVAFEPEDTQ